MMMICAEDNKYRAEHVKARSAHACSGVSRSGVKKWLNNCYLPSPIGFTRGQFQSGQAVGCCNSLPQILPALK